MNLPKTGVIIVAGGRGTRIGGTTPKQFLKIAEREILLHTILVFESAMPGCEIVLALPSSDRCIWDEIARREGLERRCTVCEGGASRAESVRNGIEAMSRNVELIGVHDGVRPLVSESLIKHLYATAEKHGTAIPVIEPADSFRSFDGNGYLSVADRSKLRAVQTPQVFSAALLRKAYCETDAIWNFTDDASLVESLGTILHFEEGETENIKITKPVDLLIAETILKSRAETPATIKRT